MALCDAYSKACFKRFGDGRLAFYPYLYGRGYVVSEEQAAVLNRFTTRAGIWVVAGGVAASLFGTVLMATVGVLLLAGYYGRLRWLTRNLERAPADQRLTLRARYRTRAQHLDWATLWFLEIIAVLFVAAGVYIAVTGSGEYPRLVGSAAVVFFGFYGWLGGYMILVKRDSK